MVTNLRLCKILWTFTTACTLIAAAGGVLIREIYATVFYPDFLPGAFPQDVLTIFVCLLLFYLIATTRQKDVKKQVVIIGLIGSIFYLYGIFTIERVYNELYLVYAAVFALSFWSTVCSLSGFRADRIPSLQLGAGALKMTAYSSIGISVVFTILWIAALIPLMQRHERIEYMYSIYILDLCLIMPAFFITAVMALRRKPMGILMGPALMILGFFVIFPLGLNELAKPSHSMAIEVGPMVVSFAFAAFMLAVAYLHLRKMRVD
jgi:hypothetical protein